MRPSKLLALSLLLPLLSTAPAAAQAPPPDERAGAQALADAVGRLVDAWDAVPDYDENAVLYGRRCQRELRRVPRSVRFSSRAGVLIRRQAARRSVAGMDPAFARFRSEIAQVATRDPVLISGRAAWRRQAKAYQALPEAVDLCADLAAWRRRGYDMATVHAAYAEFHTIVAASGLGFGRRVAAAAGRMRELGVPEADAKRFEDP